jgi:hypothetical protein
MQGTLDGAGAAQTAEAPEGSVHQEQSQPQQHTWNNKLFVILPLKSIAAHSLHIQHLCNECMAYLTSVLLL